jgi:hypothetical protein
MREIPILYEFPVIFTKDRDFLENTPHIEQGAIVLLPEDAVLVMPPPQMMEMQVAPQLQVDIPEPKKKGRK